MTAAQLNLSEIFRFIGQLKIFLSEPYEYREQLALIIIAFTILILILVFSFISFANFLESRRVRKVVKKRARRKLTPFEIAVRYVFSVVFIGLLGYTYYYTHYENKFCGNCHQITKAYMSFKNSKKHKNLSCISCHTDPGIIGKIASLPREVSNLIIYSGFSKKKTTPYVSEKSCLNCHLKEISKTTGTESKVRHSDFVLDKNSYIPCGKCHSKVGHGEVLLSAKEYCASCHNGQKAFPLKECKKCHEEDVTISKSEVRDPALFAKVGTGPIRCYNVCHPKQVDSICTPCHGTIMPHPEIFIRTHAANSYANRALCVRCHSEKGATTKRACGCHPEEGDTMHGTFEWWFIEHQKAARSNPYMNCLCHASTFGGNVCEFCHVEGNPLTKAMMQTEMQNLNQGTPPAFPAPGP